MIGESLAREAGRDERRLFDSSGLHWAWHGVSFPQHKAYLITSFLNAAQNLMAWRRYHGR